MCVRHKVVLCLDMREQVLAFIAIVHNAGRLIGLLVFFCNSYMGFVRQRSLRDRSRVKSSVVGDGKDQSVFFQGHTL